MSKRVLVVDDDESIRFVLEKALRKEGYDVSVRDDGLKGLAELEKGGYELAFMDIRMPGLDGLSVLGRMRDAGIGTSVIIMTAQGTMKTAIEAMKLGAYDHITKPFDVEEVKLLASRALENRAMAEEVENLKATLRERYEAGSIVGETPAMQEIFKTVGRVAATDVTVLITGESGTGKELIARAIHAYSRRVGGPMVVVNSAAIPSELLESELFGHEKGAFTGATARKIGKFEMASGGTIFLDEIGDMDLGLQAKLLRVLQEKELERVGGTAPIKTDARVIAATHRDLDEMSREGKFRQDLFYRLNVVSIQLPPLRERPEDIPLLVEHFLEKASIELGVARKSVSPSALRKLRNYEWPGNVRELENCVKRAVVMSSSTALLPEDVDVIMEGDKRAATSDKDVTLEAILNDRINCYIKKTNKVERGEVYQTVISLVEKPLIEAALRECGYNQVKAADLLGINRNTLRKKIKELGINLNRT